MKQREEVRRLEKIFTERTQKYLNNANKFLEYQYKRAFSVCRTPECFSQANKKYEQLEKATIAYLDFISSQLQKCIEGEAPAKGADGYVRCMTLFESILQAQSRKDTFQIKDEI